MGGDASVGGRNTQDALDQELAATRSAEASARVRAEQMRRTDAGAVGDAINKRNQEYWKDRR